ncbi:MAG: hypothetical protein DWQ05_03685 [Calditrichaeota bacterium]|nr:MAG: hypothetical protein DWQ05_03685 [Calditrichota bacterium]
MFRLKLQRHSSRIGKMEKNKYFIGIDGGGTKSSGCLINSEGNIRALGETGPTNYIQKEEPVIIERICTLVESLKEKAGISHEKPAAVVAGLSGLGSEKPRVRIKKLLEETKIAEKIMAVSDAATALEGAFAGEPGAILIAGTGSIAYGKNTGGEIFRAGGWGYLLGGEGAGFDIGRNGIAAALEDWDGRGEKTILRPQLEKYFKVSEINEAVPEIYVNYTTRGALAQFARFVFAAAQRGDKVAEKIVADAAKRLAEHIIALAPRLDKEKKIQLALLGNIFKSKKMLLPAMQQCWMEAACKIEVKEPLFPAEIGAVLLAQPKPGSLFMKNLITSAKTVKKSQPNNA